jgi:hypothetical protein
MTLEELVDSVAANLQPEQAGEFATLLKNKIENSYSTDVLKIIDDQLLAAGMDVNPACRVKHPPAP